jgi:hypothetical protein
MNTPRFELSPVHSPGGSNSLRDLKVNYLHLLLGEYQDLKDQKHLIRSIGIPHIERRDNSLSRITRSYTLPGDELEIIQLQPSGRIL